jgi:hypothetical protein
MYLTASKNPNVSGRADVQFQNRPDIIQETTNPRSRNPDSKFQPMDISTEILKSQQQLEGSKTIPISDAFDYFGVSRYKPTGFLYLYGIDKIEK